MQHNSSSILRILALLAAGPKSRKVLAETVGIDVRQVNRIIAKLEDHDFLIDKDENGNFFLFGAESLKLRKFNPSERELLNDLLTNYARFNPLSMGLLRKLNTPDYPIPFASHLKDLGKNRNIDNLRFAIERNMMVWLKPYLSPSKNKPIKDRFVCPLEIIDEHRQVLAWEQSSNREKTFKIDRIGVVELSDIASPQRKRKKQKTDPFGFSCAKQTMVKLRLSTLAARLMQEEFPLAKPLIQLKKQGHLFHGPVSSFTGIGRFVLGLPGHVTVIENAEFKVYLKELARRGYGL